MSRLRSGATDLLIATDVAARGLDVDQLTHVFNYDLPVSPEAYVHRIGRVGRAGRTGVAVSLVEPRERRLLVAIERLLGGPIPTGSMPTAADVRRLRLERTREDIEAVLADDDAQVRMEGYRDLVEEMLQRHDAVDLLLASVAIAHEATQAGASDEVEIEPVRERSEKPPKRDKRAKRSVDREPGEKKRRLDGPTQRLFVSLGREAGVTPGDLVGAVTGETSLKGKDIGAITVHDRYSLLEVPADKARKVVRELQHCTIRGRKAKVRLDRL
jgi:ATP-dependent RNA helicase DeaD